MSNDFHRQIYENLNLKETDELVSIWQKNDHVEWSDDAFNSIREILQIRLGELPPQNEPVLEYTDDHKDKEREYESDFEIQIDDGNLPEFYNPHDVLRLEKWLHQAAIVSIIASVIPVN